MGFQAVEASAPESPIEVEPFLSMRQRLAIQSADTLFAAALIGNQRGLLQNLQMSRDRGRRDGEWLGQRPNIGFALGQTSQDGSAGAVCQGIKYGVEILHSPYC